MQSDIEIAQRATLLPIADIAQRLASIDPATVVFGAFDGDALVGAVGIGRWAPAKARHRALLWGMYVAPTHRRRGLGEALVARAVDQLRHVGGIAQVELLVATTSVAARRLYRRLGFVWCGRQPRAIVQGAEAIDEDMMVLRLGAAPPRGPLRDDDRALADELAARTPSEAAPALLEVARQQAARRRPADLRDQHARDPFVALSPLDLRAVNRADAMALDAADGYDAVLLSPLAPLGCCAVVSPSHQHRIVSTSRGTEVVADPTNSLALECARRLRAHAGDVRLCTVHQVVRAQQLPPGRGFTQHFRMLALADAGRARADHGFDVDAVVRHAVVIHRLLDSWQASSGTPIGNRVVSLGCTDAARPIRDRLARRLADELPAVAIAEGPAPAPYYAGLRALVDVDAPSGKRVNVADTGLFDWMSQLMSDRRYRFVASGLGLQLLPLMFQRTSDVR